ncbi:hypothetical protein BDY19DRAFT_997326 [Irpex rosettiformis]|uniref:Uncharacterized protein n=1 Tax=Irpex rosettiformis TaxID=378272 RepID=A0ACB8TSE1_9APHY|nr:hypothetical protein BDY19DRAFT_997326 [Irpex rosettiformis]
MTRYTNVALKRSYVEAGFNYREPEEVANQAGPSNSHEDTNKVGITTEGDDAPPKSKRKRSRKKAHKSLDATGEAGPSESVGQDGPTVGAEDDCTKPSNGTTKAKATGTKASKGKKKLKQKGMKSKDARKAASEQRRLRRQDERMADVTCFACREIGHAARSCPKAIASDALEGAGGQKKLGKQAMRLTKAQSIEMQEACRSREPSAVLVVFRVYPNGGCCKLCQETTHLAKDCPMRKPEVVATTTLVGTGMEAGADEDDFHTFRRKNLEISKEEKADERRKKQQAVKVGARSGVVKAFGRTVQKPHKVVIF